MRRHKKGKEGKLKAELIYLVEAEHCVVQRVDASAPHQILLVCLGNAFVHPLQRDAEVVGKVVKRLFNIFDPLLGVVDLVEVDVPITSLYPSYIRHEATLTDLRGILVIHLNI